MFPEVNGNPPSVTKRKKNRDKKQATVSEGSPDRNTSNRNYYTPPGTCRNNTSVPDVSTYYSFMNCSTTEPMSLPLYPLSYPNYPVCPGLASTPRHHDHPYMDGSEYLSLPVMDRHDVDADKRRFSDPGLPNESDSSCSNSVEERVVRKMVQQIDSLMESNRRLSREVMELKVEVDLMRQQFGSRHRDREYEPGMLADIVREVRDAARVREDALLARVRHLIEEKQLSLNHMHVIAEKNKNNDRIGKLEEQMKVMALHNQRSDEAPASNILQDDPSSSSCQVLELEREALELRRELQDTRAKKEESEQKLAQLDKKLSNLLLHHVSTSDVSEDGKTASIECLSTITSASSASHVQSPRVTLSGPVTDL